MKRTKQPKTDIVRNLPFIRQIAWSFHTTTGIEFEDLLSESYVIYLESLKKYDSKKGKITTYMYYCLHSRLKNYVKQNKSYNQCLHKQVDNEITCKSYFDEMTDEAYKIAQIIIRSPKKYVYASNENIENRIKNILVTQGWNIQRINAGLNCLKTIFK